MMSRNHIYLYLLATAALSSTLLSVEQIPSEQAKKIAEAAPAKSQVVPKRPRRVLIWITPPHLMEEDPHKGYCIPYGTAAFETLGRKSGAFEPVVSDDLIVYLPENIRQYDAIVMNNSSGSWITPTDADMTKEAFKKYGADKAAVEEVLRKSLLDYVANGGGIMAIHYAIGANRHWPEFQQLLGATFTGHPWNEEVGITVEEPEHPLAAAFGGKDFRLADEIFQYGDPYDRGKVRVLLSLDPERTNMGVKWINRDDNDFALAWVKSYGKGRIFYTSFGHRTELYWNPELLKFYLDAIQCVSGDLDAPTAPRSDHRVRRAPGPTPPEARAAKMNAGDVPVPSEEEIQRVEAATPLRIYIVTDLEGASGVYQFAQTREPGNPLGEKAKEYLMGDIAAIVRGLRAAHMTDIVVLDGHGSQAFVPHLMEPGAKYITGKPRPGPLTCLDESFAGLIQLGAHSMMGTPDGLLAHTQSSRSENRYWYNGVESGELAQCAAIAGHYGIPTIMVTGDEATCREAVKFFGPNCVTVAVKRGITREAAMLYPFDESRKALYDGARRAVAIIPQCKPYKLSLPIEAKKEYLVFDSPSGPGRQISKKGTIEDVLKLLDF